MAGLSEEFKLDFKFGGNVEFITRLEALMKRIDEKFDSVQDSIEEASDATDEMTDSVKDLNREVTAGVTALHNFGENLKDVVKYYISFAAAKRGAESVWRMGRESMEIFSTQERAENQLKGVMKNRGTLSNFGAIKSYAAELQRGSIYGDEALIKGAGELATYVKGTESLKSMMGLLTDYAAGMTGGGEVSPDQMESLATGLGMAYDGNYMAMRRKGFDTSKLEALDAILETGGRWGAKERKKYGDVLDAETLAAIRKNGGVTEQMRVDALKESLGDWKGLSDTVNDLSSSAIIKFNNKLGDLRENLGQKIYPVFNRLIETIDKNMPMVEAFFDDVGEIFESMVETISENITDIMQFGKELMSIVTTFAKGAIQFIGFTNKVVGFKKAIIALVGAMAVGKVMEFANAIKVANVAMGGQNGAGGLVAGIKNLASAANTTTGKLGLVEAALWGLQQIGELVSASIDYANESLKEKYRNDAGKDMNEAIDKREAARKEMQSLVNSMSEEERAGLSKMSIGSWQPGDAWSSGSVTANADFGRYGGMQSMATGANVTSKMNEWARKKAEYNYWERTRKDAKEKFDRNLAGASRKNPMDATMAAARKDEEELSKMQKDSKGDVTMYNSYSNTNIEQNVSVAADMQKIGILLNQNIRSIIEKQLRQNREVSYTHGN